MVFHDFVLAGSGCGCRGERVVFCNWIIVNILVSVEKSRGLPYFIDYVIAWRSIDMVFGFS